MSRNLPQIPRTPWAKAVRALWAACRRPGAVTSGALRALAQVYREDLLARSPIPVVEATDLVGADADPVLLDCVPKNGNVHWLELWTIAALTRRVAPTTALEIGTFDGNTALQIAANLPEDGTVFTLDLPTAEQGASGDRAGPGSAPGAASYSDAGDGRYVNDASRAHRKYSRHHCLAKRVVQWLGDSASFDFAGHLEDRQVQLAFIDGSHGYRHVAHDTEQVLARMAPGGIVLWHDYTAVWPGVIRFLDELGQHLSLARVAGTTLVVHRVPASAGNAKASDQDARAPNTQTAAKIAAAPAPAH